MLESLKIDKSWFGLLISLFLITAFTFLLTPVTGDVFVFLGSAHQIDYMNNESFIADAYNTWNLRGMYARVFMCFLYKLALLFSDYPSYHFELFIRLFYFLMIVTISLISSVLIEKSATKRLQLFLIINSIIVACHYSSSLQQEMTAIVLMILSFSIVINAEETGQYKNVKLFIAGLLLGCLPYLKSIFVILPLSFFASLFLWSYTKSISLKIKDIEVIIMGGFVMITIGVLSIVMIYPSEIQDILDTSVFQKTLINGGFTSIKHITTRFVYNFVYSGLFRIPSVFIGTLILLGLFATNLRVHNLKNVVLHILLWFFPALIIILSNQFFAYHFYLFVFPAFFEIYLLFENTSNSILDENMIGETRIVPKISLFVLALIIALTCMFKDQLFFSNEGVAVKIFGFFFSIIAIFLIYFKFKEIRLSPKVLNCFLISCFALPSFIYIGYISCFSSNVTFYQKMNAFRYFEVNKLIEKYPDLTYRTILFLDDGLGSYLLAGKSFLKYTFPLPLQRIDDKSVYRNIKCRVDCMSAALKFGEKYIAINEDWFLKNSANSIIMEKINLEYKLTENVDRYDYTWDFFSGAKSAHVVEKIYIRN